MATNDADEKLNQILKKTQTLLKDSLLPDEINFLTSVFLSTRPDAATVRSKAYVALSAYCQAVRESKGKEKVQGSEPDEATKAIVNTFGPSISDYLGETSENLLLTGISFLTALFQVDSQAASTIFTEDGLVENVMDTVDLTPSPLLCQEVAHLLGQASGHKSCRGVMTPQIVRWLEFKSRQPTDFALSSAASVALIKLAKGSVSDAPDNGTPEVRSGQTGELTQRMVAIITSGTSDSAVDAVEGLAYLSTDPSVKETLSKNATFLKSLFNLVPQTKATSSAASKELNPTLIYGVLLLICNLTSFRPHLTEEQQQIEKLKKMTKAGKGLSEELPEASLLDDDDHVKERIRLLLASGVLPVLAAAVSLTDSPGVRVSAGKSLLSISEEKENRGKILQAGGARVLQIIVKQALASQPAGVKSQQTTLVSADLESIQALAKLAITSSPVQVFGPNIGAMYDSIRPFSILLQHPSSNLLQRFEAIMALTNLASHSPDMSSRIAKADGLLDHVELLLLEEHVLVRRASTELICNLIVGSDDTFERYAGDSPSSVSKLHVLLALSDVDDVPTRLASSGALATLTAGPTACSALISLQLDKHRFLAVMTQIIDPSCLPKSNVANEPVLDTNSGLVHRGVVCVSNVFQSISDTDTREKIFKQATESGLIRALFLLVKGEGVVKDQAIIQPASEALKAIMKKN